MKVQRATFVERSNCINCRSSQLAELSHGSYSDEPLRSFIEKDPWGISPIPYVDHESYSFVQCSDCHQLFHRRILSPQWMMTCYSEWVTAEAIKKFGATESITTKFDKGMKFTHHILDIEKLTRSVRGNDILRILDFGCGWGEFLSMCATYGFLPTGVDFSPGRREFSNITILPSIDDLKPLVDSNRLFHAVTLFQVLEHLAEPRAVLECLYELITLGGILVLETPDCTGVSGITTKNDYRKIHPLSHINGFTPATLRSIAERTGFSTTKRPYSYVTNSPARVLRTGVKSIVGTFIKKTTSQYFVKC